MCEGVTMTEEEIFAAYEQDFLSLAQHVARLEGVLEAHPFMSVNLQHVVVHALALRLIELAKGCDRLGRAGLAAANSAMGRLFLEIAFKLKAVSLSEADARDYALQEQVSRYANLKKILTSPSARTAVQRDTLDEYLAEMAAIEEELGSKVASRHVAARDWAKRAGQEEIYLFAYAAFSEFVHAGPGSLAHIMETRAEGQIFMQTGPSAHLLQRVLAGVCLQLESSACAIEEMFGRERELGLA